MIHSRRAAACIAFLCALTLHAQTPPAKPGIDKSSIESYMRHLHVWGPQITVTVSDPKEAAIPGLMEVNVLATAGQASARENVLVSADGTRIIRGTLYELKRNPFQNDIDKLQIDGAPVMGPAGAPVTIVVFSDLQCGFCKEEAKILRQNLPQTFPKEVKLVFKDYPLDAIHPWARPAAIAGRCIARQNNEIFWQYHDWVFEKQAELTAENLKEKVAEWTKGRPLEPISLAACIDGRATEPEVSAAFAQGRQLNVDSTPTLFLNGRRLVGQQSWPQLKMMIEHELAFQKKQAEEGKPLTR